MYNKLQTETKTDMPDVRVKIRARAYVMTELVSACVCLCVLAQSARCYGNVLYIPHLSPHHSSTIFHIEPHFRHSTPYHISLIKYHQITHGVMCIVWCGIWCDVECFAMPDVGCCALFILMWL